MIIYKCSVISGAVFSLCCLIVTILILIEVYKNDHSSDPAMTTESPTTEFTSFSGFSGDTMDTTTGNMYNSTSQTSTLTIIE